MKIQLKEICLLEECENRKRCQKRHQGPKNLLRGHWEFGDSCRFDHRHPKYLRSLIFRLDALEKDKKRENGWTDEQTNERTLELLVGAKNNNKRDIPNFLNTFSTGTFWSCLSALPTFSTTVWSILRNFLILKKNKKVLRPPMSSSKCFWDLTVTWLSP